MSDMNHEEMAMQAEETWAAWKDFERRLLTLVEAMKHPLDRLVLEVGDTEELPTVQFRNESGELAATIDDGEYNERVCGREPIVHRAIMLLRNIAGIPHPDLLTYRAEGRCAQYSAILGLERTGMWPEPDVYLVPDAGRLLDLIDGVLSRDHEIDRDDDGDIVIVHMGQRVWVRVIEGAPAIEIFTRVAHGARSRRQAAVEVGILNRSNPWVWWQVAERSIIQTATVDSMPFVPDHLTSTLEVFLNAMTATRDDLALRVGGEVA